MAKLLFTMKKRRRATINEGKKFEEDIKKSIPSWCWCYRFRDSAGTWQGGENTRFTPSNISDYMVMGDRTLYLLELKTHKGSSIPFNCLKQAKKMSEVKHPSVKAYFIINFRDKELTYAVEAVKVQEYISSSTRKSIPYSWCQENGIEIQGTRKRIRFRYDLEEFLRGDKVWEEQKKEELKEK